MHPNMHPNMPNMAKYAKYAYLGAPNILYYYGSVILKIVLVAHLTYENQWGKWRTIIQTFFLGHPYGHCCTAQCDSSSITTCSQHCTLLYFVWKHRSSPFRQILVMLLVVVDGALHRKWAGADSFWVSCKPAACLSVVKKKVSQKESGGFGFVATLLVAEHNKVKI